MLQSEIQGVPAARKRSLTSKDGALAGGWLLCWAKASFLHCVQCTSQGTHLSLGVYFESHTSTVQCLLIACCSPIVHGFASNSAPVTHCPPVAQCPLAHDPSAAWLVPAARGTLVEQRVFAAHSLLNSPPACLSTVYPQRGVVSCSISACSPSIVHGPQFNACQLFTVHSLFVVFILFNAHPLLHVRPQRAARLLSTPVRCPMSAFHLLFDVSQRYPGFPETCAQGSGPELFGGRRLWLLLGSVRAIE